MKSLEYSNFHMTKKILISIKNNDYINIFFIFAIISNFKGMTNKVD